jgi:two-component system OmpR family response regulator
MPLCIVVEDHADTREGYAEWLSFEGMRVRTAGDGDELHQLMGVETPDAFVMDLHLPGDDGWTLIREIRSAHKTRNVPVVVVSASVQESDRQSALEAGCDSFLAKPCDPRDLLAELKRLINARAVPAAGE